MKWSKGHCTVDKSKTPFQVRCLVCNPADVKDLTNFISLYFSVGIIVTLNHVSHKALSEVHLGASKWYFDVILWRLHY